MSSLTTYYIWCKGYTLCMYCMNADQLCMWAMLLQGTRQFMEIHTADSDERITRRESHDKEDESHHIHKIILCITSTFISFKSGNIVNYIKLSKFLVFFLF